MITKPNLNDAPAYCEYFINLVPTENLMQELFKSKENTISILKNLPKEKWHFAYAENKWTSLELIRHIIDCERIFAYRIFRFSRFDTAELMGFDEDKYIENTKNLDFTLQDVIEEFEVCRNATSTLFKQINNEMLDFRGKANKLIYTARSLGYMAVGHNLHHINFLEKNYL